MKHFMIGASYGYEESLKAVMEYYKRGWVTKNDLEKTLRAYKDAVDAAASENRKIAEKEYGRKHGPKKRMAPAPN